MKNKPKPSPEMEAMAKKWLHTKGAAALLMTTSQHVYHEVMEILLRLEALGSEKLYKKHVKFRKILIERMEIVRKQLDSIYTNCLNISVPLTNEDNKGREARGEIRKARVIQR